MDDPGLPRHPSPLDTAIGLTFDRRDGNGVRLRLDPTAVAHGGLADPPYLHGGTLATCVDTAAWYAVVAEAGGAWVVVDLRLDCLRPARAEPQLVTAQCRRAGRRLAVADVVIAPSERPDRVTALGRATLARVADG